jgi:Co/Zn/Cd efflux system component
MENNNENSDFITIYDTGNQELSPKKLIIDARNDSSIIEIDFKKIDDSSDINFKVCQNKDANNLDQTLIYKTNQNFSTIIESGELIANIKEQTEIVDRNSSLINHVSHPDSDSLILTNIDRNSNSNSQNDRDGAVNFNIKMLVNSGFGLMKKNDEFFYLVIFLSIWLCLMLAELLYGVSNTKVHIISDSFFNLFKSMSILITVFSILLTRIFNFNSLFLKNRIELIAALSNTIFLIIVSMYMCLQALHIVTETDEGENSDYGHDSDEAGTIYFFKNFYIFKIIVDVLVILNLSDYILHPSIKLKLLLWKKNHSWKNLNEFDLDNLKESKSLIKIWNNHFENMNALIINMSSDLVSSILFVMWFYISKDQHFEYAYCFISVINLIVVLILIYPVLSSIFLILMQGKSEVYESFYKKMQTEISYYEGCLGIKEMKVWMTSQNDIKC